MRIEVKHNKSCIVMKNYEVEINITTHVYGGDIVNNLTLSLYKKQRNLFLHRY